MSSWKDHIFVDGWIRGEHGLLHVTDVSTGEVLSSVGWAGPKDVDTAATAAQAASRRWARKSMAERANCLQRLSDNLVQNMEEISYWLVREAGATIAKAQREIDAAQAEISHCIDNLRADVVEESEFHNSDRKFQTTHDPVGVVSIITPFNAPLILAMRAVIPAIAYGNGVILKPDPRTAVAGGLLFPDLLEGTGIPAGLLSVLPGHGDVGNKMASHELVSSVLFTGSTDVGRIVGETAGRNLKRIGLELGGNNPVIVLEDADLMATVERSITSSFLHSGQICMTAGQYYVAAGVYHDFVEAFVECAKQLSVGNPWADPNTDMGPIIDDLSVKRIQGMVDCSVAKGAVLSTGGKSIDRMFPATVLTDVPDGAPAWYQEVFGPVAAIQPMKNLEETLDGLSHANYGLVAAVHSGDDKRARDVANRLIAGTVRINDVTNYDNPRTPMVGRKESGNMSAFGGPEMRELLTVPKVISQVIKP